MPTPQEIEALRNSLTQNRKLKESNLTSFDFSAQNITASLSSSDQPKGIAKISTFLVNKIQSLQTKVLPSFNLIASELGIKNFGTSNEELPTTCPTPEQLTTILQIRDGIVSQLNETSKLIQKYSGVFNKLLDGINAQIAIILNSKQVKKAVSTTQKITSAASKIIPSPPGLPGIIGSTLSDLAAAANSLDNIIKNIQFDDQGNPKLSAQIGNFNAGFTTLTYLDTVIQGIITKLNSIDTVLLRCGATLAPLDPALQQVAENSSDILYKGFILRVEEIKFNDTLTQKQGVAYNKSGIALLKTDVSFTSDIQTLINTLKFIIDKDNLKAN
jgi:hypothetical protein